MKRFWDKTKRNAETGCLEWTASLASKRWPYGQFGMPGFNSPQRAHRVAWMLLKGKIPEGGVIMHVCDNPRCVEITHLKLGTHADNVADKVAKGRHGSPGKVNIGERNGLSKLTASDVREIRKMSGRTLGQIAKKYAVGTSCIHSIIKRQTWKHI